MPIQQSDLEEKHDSKNALATMRHSFAHVLAAAVLELWQKSRLGVGPATEDGFYYDIEIRDADGKSVMISDADLRVIEERMRQSIRKGFTFEGEEHTKEEAVRYWADADQPYKVEMLENIPGDVVTYYRHDDFVDLCRGPHVGSSKDLRFFELTKVSGAYWKGDSTRPQLQRIYGIAFETRADLENYKTRLKEAERRDHRRLAQVLDLFHFEEDAGRGLPLYHPDAALMRSIIARFLEDEHLKRGYDLVSTPYILTADLWKKTGHEDHYRDMMFFLQKDDEAYAIKPMNCPGHILIYRHKIRSYRDLPIRYYEFGTVLRAEFSGTVHGLTRARLFTQDDAHIFCRPDQVQSEVVAVVDFAVDMLETFGFGYKLFLATRPEKGYVGTDEMWDQATAALEAAMQERGVPYEVLPGEGAFYGPKIEFSLLDAIGRKWTGPTIQVDFNTAKSLGATYRDADDTEKPPVMIHRVVLGSWERFFGVAIEHFAGAFPVWMSAKQVNIVPVSERFLDYAREIRSELLREGIRAVCDEGDDTMGYKIRQSEILKIPYTLIVGEREAQTGTISVRRRGRKDLGSMTVRDFLERIKEEIQTKVIDD
jgi:threonyl-tRNA synthetase